MQQDKCLELILELLIASITVWLLKKVKNHSNSKHGVESLLVELVTLLLAGQLTVRHCALWSTSVVILVVCDTVNISATLLIVSSGSFLWYRIVNYLVKY